MAKLSPRYAAEHNRSQLVAAVVPWLVGAWEYCQRVNAGKCSQARWASPEYRLVSYYVSYLPTPMRLALPAPA